MSDSHPQNSVQSTGIRVHFALTLATWSGPDCRFKSGEVIHQSDKRKSHLNEGEVTADDSVLLLGVINLPSIDLAWKERGKG